jgi:hypothetical protein
MRCILMIGPVVMVWSLAAVSTANAQTRVEHRPAALEAAPVTEASPATLRSLRRIASSLQSSASADAVGSLLRVDVDLQVFGLAPAPALVEKAELGIGKPVYGAPTHDEMLTLATPSPFRSTAPYRRLRPSVSLDR